MSVFSIKDKMCHIRKKHVSVGDAAVMTLCSFITVEIYLHLDYLNV